MGYKINYNNKMYKVIVKMFIDYYAVMTTIKEIIIFIINNYALPC